MDRLWAMQVFVRVIECGSFSRAAASLDLANATVTACVRNLEKHLGITLINRNTRFLGLTDEGQQFLQDCRDILQSVERAEANVQTQIGDMRGVLRVEMPISIGHALICPALSAFSARHPNISVAVTLTNQPHHLIERSIDIAIRMGSVEDEALIARPIYEARYMVCGKPELVARLGGHPSQLDTRLCLGLVNEGSSTPLDWRLRQGDEEVVIRPNGPLHFNSSDALIGAALQGTGLVHVLDVFANRYIASGALQEAHPDWATRIKPFYAVTSKARVTSMRIRAFIDFLLDTLDVHRRPGVGQAVAVVSSGRCRP